MDQILQSTLAKNDLEWQKFISSKDNRPETLEHLSEALLRIHFLHRVCSPKPDNWFQYEFTMNRQLWTDAAIKEAVKILSEDGFKMYTTVKDGYMERWEGKVQQGKLETSTRLRGLFGAENTKRMREQALYKSFTDDMTDLDEGFINNA